MGIRTVNFTKGSHHFQFRYDIGCEDEMVEELMKMADAETSILTWLDVANLSFQVTCGAAADCARTLSPSNI